MTAAPLSRPARRRPPRGNALVEFALVLPLFLTIVLAAIDWGWYFTVREVVVNATRQGARIGSIAPSGSEVADATTAVQGYLQSALGPSYVVAPTVTVGVNAAGYTVVIVSLASFPTVSSRPADSLSGLSAWTQAPATVSAQAEMRR